jgi:histidine phosphotransferase ChpT
VQLDSTSLAALIGSRICHDLINPIGAISNGLELVAMGAPSPTSPEMTLIQQSCDNATARIRFFRIAFGSANDRGPVAARDARATLADNYVATRILTDWHADQTTPRHVVQVGFLCALCLEAALPQGGLLTITTTDTAVVAEAAGPVVQRDTGLWQWLDAPQPTSELRPAHVQFALLAQLCRDGFRISDIAFTEGQARMAVQIGSEVG